MYIIHGFLLCPRLAPLAKNIFIKPHWNGIQYENFVDMFYCGRIKCISILAKKNRCAALQKYFIARDTSSRWAATRFFSTPFFGCVFNFQKNDPLVSSYTQLTKVIRTSSFPMLPCKALQYTLFREQISLLDYTIVDSDRVREVYNLPTFKQPQNC